MDLLLAVPAIGGSMNSIDLPTLLEEECNNVTGKYILPRDRIVYFHKSPDKPNVLIFTHAQIVVSVPDSITEPGDPLVIVDSRRGPDDGPPGAVRYHRPASGDVYATDIFRIYRLKPCQCSTREDNN